MVVLFNDLYVKPRAQHSVCPLCQLDKKIDAQRHVRALEYGHGLRERAKHFLLLLAQTGGADYAGHFVRAAIFHGGLCRGRAGKIDQNIGTHGSLRNGREYRNGAGEHSRINARNDAAIGALLCQRGKRAPHSAMNSLDYDIDHKGRSFLLM